MPSIAPPVDVCRICINTRTNHNAWGQQLCCCQPACSAAKCCMHAPRTRHSKAACDRAVGCMQRLATQPTSNSARLWAGGSKHCCSRIICRTSVATANGVGNSSKLDRSERCHVAQVHLRPGGRKKGGWQSTTAPGSAGGSATWNRRGPHTTACSLPSAVTERHATMQRRCSPCSPPH